MHKQLDIIDQLTKVIAMPTSEGDTNSISVDYKLASDEESQVLIEVPKQCHKQRCSKGMGFHPAAIHHGPSMDCLPSWRQSNAGGVM